MDFQGGRRGQHPLAVFVAHLDRDVPDIALRQFRLADLGSHALGGVQAGELEPLVIGGKARPLADVEVETRHHNLPLDRY